MRSHPNEPRPNDPRWWLAALCVSVGIFAPPALAKEHPVTEAAPQADDQPVSLVVTPEDGLIDVRVITAALCDCGGRFRIESQGGNANRSVNTSTFGSLEEVGRVLSHVRFGRSEDWSVRLTVSIEGRDDYIVVRTSGEES